MKTNFLRYIHHFRGLAIILIVGVHCRTSLLWPEDSLPNTLLTFGLNSSTILFVFISGFLFQFLNEEKLGYQDYLTKKIKFVVVPYILASIPAILDKLIFESDTNWMNSFYRSLYPPFQAIYMLCTGKHSGPFYFIPMICIIFLIAPLLQKLQKSKYFTITAVCIVLLGLFTYTYGYYASILESLIYFLPVYIFGMWISKNRARILTMKSYALFSLISIFLIIYYLEISKVINVQHLYFFESAPHYFTSQFNWSKLKEMILAIILLTLFYRLESKNYKLLVLLGSYSFGIYYIHIYFINIAEKLLDYFHISRLQNGIGYLSLLLLNVSLSVLTV